MQVFYSCSLYEIYVVYFIVYTKLENDEHQHLRAGVYHRILPTYFDSRSLGRLEEA